MYVQRIALIAEDSDARLTFVFWGNDNVLMSF